MSLLCIALFLAVVSITLASNFNSSQAMISLYLSSATFCNVSTYGSRVYTGPTEGFVWTSTINSLYGTVGFVGYLPSDQSIYIAFRGSSSARNWLSDLDVLKVSYDSFPQCECQVSKGFYSAEQSVLPHVLREVSKLKALHPHYAVKVTGHSYGAAIAQLLSMDLAKAGIASSVINFGQPRTGDAKYAQFVGQHFATSGFPETWRVVHNRDIVPHWPFNQYLNYSHVCTEEWEDETGALRTCGSTSSSDGFSVCEDPTCSDQFKPHEWRPDDHMTYLGLYISCDSVSLD